MELAKLIEQAETLLAQDQSRAAIDLLLEYYAPTGMNTLAGPAALIQQPASFEETHKQLVVQSAAFNRLNTAFHNGLIDWTTYDTSSNRVIYTLTTIVQTLKRFAPEPAMVVEHCSPEPDLPIDIAEDWSPSVLLDDHETDWGPSGGPSDVDIVVSCFNELGEVLVDRDKQ